MEGATAGSRSWAGRARQGADEASRVDRLADWAASAFDEANDLLGRQSDRDGDGFRRPDHRYRWCSDAIWCANPQAARRQGHGARCITMRPEGADPAGRRIGTVELRIEDRFSLERDLLAGDDVAEGTFAGRAADAIQELAFGWIRSPLTIECDDVRRAGAGRFITFGDRTEAASDPDPASCGAARGSRRARRRDARAGGSRRRRDPPYRPVRSGGEDGGRNRGAAFCAADYDHVRSVIVPALREGAFVLCEPLSRLHASLPGVGPRSRPGLPGRGGGCDDGGDPTRPDADPRCAE